MNKLIKYSQYKTHTAISLGKDCKGTELLKGHNSKSKGHKGNWRLLTGPFSQFSPVVRVLRPTCEKLTMYAHAQSRKKKDR